MEGEIELSQNVYGVDPNTLLYLEFQGKNQTGSVGNNNNNNNNNVALKSTHVNTRGDHSCLNGRGRRYVSHHSNVVLRVARLLTSPSATVCEMDETIYRSAPTNMEIHNDLENLFQNESQTK